MRRLASPTRLFVAGFLLLQCAWVLTVPPFRGIDEFDHAYRASAVAGGQWSTDRVPADGRGLLVEARADVVEAAEAQCEHLRYTGPDNCTAAGDAPDGRVQVASGAATYYPAYYWVVGTAAEPFRGATALYVMRVVSLLLCAVFVGLAAWASSRARTSWPLVGLAVALTPVLVYSTTVAAPNGLEMAAAVALWTSLLRVRVEPDAARSRALLVVAAAAAAVMCSLRLLGPLWVVLVVATVVALDPAGARGVVRRHVRLVAGGAVVVLLALAAFVLWMRGPADVYLPDDGADVAESLSPLHVVLWAVQSIAAFPYRNQLGPPAVYAVVGTVALLLVVAAARAAHGRHRVVLLGSLAVAILLPLAATLATYDGTEIIWQGRYGLPYGVGFVLLAATLLAERPEPHPLARGAVVAAAAAYAVALAWCLLQVRHAELTDNPASVADPAWHVPPPVLLVLLVLVALAAWAGAVTSSVAEVPEREVVRA